MVQARNASGTGSQCRETRRQRGQGGFVSALPAFPRAGFIGYAVRVLAFALFLLIAWIVTASGLQIAGRLRLPPAASRLERGLIAYALGLGVLAYGMLGLGLAHGLYPLGVGALLTGLAVLGGQQHTRLFRGLRARFGRGVHWPLRGWGMAFLLAVFAGTSLLGVYSPPTSLEWDSLAYHLADPKIYIQRHQIVYLPWESHSNFAFTAEMWYTAGLLLGGVPLAKWFHLSCAVGTCLTLYALGRRHLTPNIGVGAAVLFASMPLVFWEAGTAYADLATTFYATLTLLVLSQALLSPPTDKANFRPWLLVSAALMGLTLSTKATALSLLVLLALGLAFVLVRVWKQSGRPALRTAAAWAALALLVGSPWYIKSAVLTHNPVYPFYSQIFGGRYWNRVNAAAYDQSNADFGMGRTADKLLLAPWNLTMFLTPGRPLPPRLNAPLKQSFNDRQFPTMLLTPVLLGALFFPCFGLRAPRCVKALGAYALGSGLFWFATAQHVRYLLPILPVLCLLTAWVIVQAIAARWRSGYALAALAIGSLLLSLAVAAQIGRVQGPVALGLTSRRAYLEANEPTYPAMAFINTHLPANAKLVFYGSPLGFYCDRTYLWGEALHSAYIPYARFHSASDLNHWYAAHGITHVLVNPQSFGFAPGDTWPGWVYQLSAGTGAPLYSGHGVQVYALPPAR